MVSRHGDDLPRRDAFQPISERPAQPGGLPSIFKKGARSPAISSRSHGGTRGRCPCRSDIATTVSMKSSFRLRRPTIAAPRPARRRSPPAARPARCSAAGGRGERTGASRRGDHEVPGAAMHHPQGGDQPPEETITVRQKGEAVGRKPAAVGQPPQRVESVRRPHGGVGVTRFHLPGLHEVFHVHQAARAVLGVHRSGRDQLGRLAAAHVPDVGQVERPAGVRKAVADVLQACAEVAVAGNGPEFDERHALELRGAASLRVILVEARQREARLPARPWGRSAGRSQTRLPGGRPRRPGRSGRTARNRRRW